MSKEWEYAEHSKKVSEHGGPNQYDTDMINLGRLEGGTFVAVIGLIGFGIYKGAHYINEKLKDIHSEKVQYIKNKYTEQKEKPES